MLPIKSIAPWYRAEDYQRIREVMSDKGNFPETFQEWAQLADGQLAQVIAQGIAVEKVIIDPDGFVRFCKETKVEPDRKARVQYAHVLNSREKPGNA